MLRLLKIFILYPALIGLIFYFWLIIAVIFSN